MSEARQATMLATMARMQDRHNQEVHPDWRNQGYAYYRAIWVECAEMLDHFGWKWWKAQSPDVDQVKLELVDIWHFGLSDLIRADALDDAILSVFEPTAAAADPETLRLAIEALAATTLTQKKFAVREFAAAAAALPLPFDELYQMYVGKNVLNNFRQHHGYKDGSYRKLWQGREDNEHLVELMSELDFSSADAPEQLYSGLAQRYALG